MTDLGNLNSRLRLECRFCQWVPPEGMQMAIVQAHFDMDHDTGVVHLNLVPACTCGASMEHTESRPTGGGSKDYFRCSADGSTGFVVSQDGRPEKGSQQ